MPSTRTPLRSRLAACSLSGLHPLAGALLFLLPLASLGCSAEAAPPGTEPAVGQQATPQQDTPAGREVQEPAAAPEADGAERVERTARDADESLPRHLGLRRQGRDWPTFLGPQRDSRSPERGILKDWQKNPPRIVWQRELGTSYGIGSVSRGRYFQFDRVDDEAVLLCLNSETGKLLWKYSYPTQYEDLYGYEGGPRCSPVIDGNRVYILGAEGMLHCLRIDADRDDDRLLWKANTNKQFGVVQNFFGVGSTPIIYRDLLITMIGGSPEANQQLPPGRLDLVQGNGSGIVAFDKWTGEVEYSITDELASYASPRIDRIGGRDWAFAFCRGGLVGFQPADGKVGFQFPWRASTLESVNASSPVVVDDEVLISETYGPGAALLKVGDEQPEVVWQDERRSREKSLQTHWNTPVYVDGYVYGSSGRHTYNAELRCVEWKTGKVMWSEPGLTRASLLYVDGHFVCLGEDGTLRLLRVNPRKYEEVSKLTLKRDEADAGDERGLLKYPCWSAPILSRGLLYVRGKDRLVCLELIPESAP